MERFLNIMILLSPVGLAIIACVGFGLALAARQALDEERGRRAAAESARAAALRTLAINKDWEMDEVCRFRRLLDCHIETIVAEATDFRARPVPSPGGILESLCSWNKDWKRQLSTSAGIGASDVERLLKNDLPVTPPLARKLELFTAAPARFWERLWRLHDEYRTETDQTVMLLLDHGARADKDAAPKRPVLELVDDGPTVTEPAPTFRFEPTPATKLPPVLQPPPPAAPPKRRETADGTTLRRAATLTDFPLMNGNVPQASGGGWTEVERSPLSATVAGVGSKPSQ